MGIIGLILVFVIVQAIFHDSKSESGGAAVESKEPRKNWGRQYKMPLAFFVFFAPWLFLLALPDISLFTKILVASLISILIFPSFTLLPIVRSSIIGVPKLTYFATRLCQFRFGNDNRGTAVLFAALMWSKTSFRKSDTLGPWLVERQRKGKVGGAGIFAAGLISQNMGYPDQGRRFITFLKYFDARTVSKPGHVYWLRWRAAEAMERGAWSEVVDLCISPRLDNMLRFFSACAESLSFEKAPSPKTLKFSWLLAGQWRATKALLDAALTPPKPQATQKPDAKRPIQALELDALIAHHHHVCSDPKASTFEALAQQWELYFESDALWQKVNERARELEAHDPGLVMDTFQEQVRHDLRDIAAKLGHHHSTASSRLIEEASAHAHEEELTRFEEDMRHYRDRVDTDHFQGVWYELITWLELAERCEKLQAQSNTEDRNYLFGLVSYPLSHSAIWFYNQRSETALGNAMFSWLHEKAEDAGHIEDTEIYASNIRLGI